MIAFSPPAERRFAAYLADVRAALFGHPDVSPDDVEADVREHVNSEFATLNRPVTLGELEAVLERLGPPTQWGNTAAARPADPAFSLGELFGAIRRGLLGVARGLWRGPEDWRLPYLTFVLTLLAPLTLGLSLFAAYFLGRAALELAKEKGQPLGARRWLVYPALVLFSLPLLLGFAVGPAVGATVGVYQTYETARQLEGANWLTASKRPVPDGVRANFEQLLGVVRSFPLAGDGQEVLFGAFAFVGAAAAWWLLCGLFFWAFPRWPTALFHPLLDGYTGGHGQRVAAGCAVVLMLWGGLAYRLWSAAG
jgi:hypothetical protein